MTRPSKRVIVIGGGIIGGLSAYFLSQKGRAVTILEKDHFGQGASHGNCGLVVPGHSTPLNTPANLIKGLRWMLKKDAPLYIGIRTEAAWIQWFIQFIRHCFGECQNHDIAERSALMTQAVEWYDQFIKQEQIDCNWDHSGTCHFFRNQREYIEYGRDHLRGNFDDSDFLSLNQEAIRQHAPTVTSEVIGGYHDRKAASLRPDEFMEGLAAVLKNKGVDIVEKTECFGLGRKNGMAASVYTNRGKYRAEAFVLATGAWTPLFAANVQCRVPILPGKGYSITVKRPDNAPAIPCFLEERRVVITPWKEAMRLGGTMEFAGFDDSLNPSRLNSLERSLDEYMPLSISQLPKEEWSGWRPMTWDGLPVIDYLPGFDNVVVAAGHNELGITMAPATGHLVAEMIKGHTPTIDPSFYRFDRF